MLSHDRSRRVLAGAYAFLVHAPPLHLPSSSRCRPHVARISTLADSSAEDISHLSSSTSSQAYHHHLTRSSPMPRKSLPSSSSRSQVFEPQSEDEKILWEVIEITNEKSGKYQVRWAGDDPDTGKPWPLDWISKKDCTVDLVESWKKKKAEKKARKGL